MQKLVAYYLVVVNIWTFLLYVYDKRQAVKNLDRVSERKLHFYTLIGGGIGATLAMVLARHKIQKNSFMVRYYLIMLLWIVWLVLYFSEINPLNFVM